MSDPKKFVKNTLFNPSVTGSTFEDFSQSAILLPAMEKPPLQPIPDKSVQHISSISDTSINNNNNNNYESPAVLTPVESFNSQPQIAPVSPSYFHQPLLEQEDSKNIPQSKNLVSVLSSFSNYLRLGTPNTASSTATSIEEITTPIPTFLENLPVPDQNYVPPLVPLFNPTTLVTTSSSSSSEISSPPPSSLNSTTNNFRRSVGLKKPTYAQIPNLTSHHHHQQNLINNSQKPAAAAAVVLASSSVSPASSTSSIQDATLALNNQFKPINPHPALVPSVKPNIPLPQHHSSSSSSFIKLGPIIMDSVSAEEILSETFPDSSKNGPGQVAEIGQGSKIYRPVYNHWFYKKGDAEKFTWIPFSMLDSLVLEDAFSSDPAKVVATDGGRHDVNILERKRIPVYWNGPISEVRRCSWFFKNPTDRSPVPFEEDVSKKLEEEFKIAFESNQWHRKVQLTTAKNGEIVEFHGPDVLVLLPPNQSGIGGNSPNQRPRTVKRGMDEFNIDEGEPAQVDHVLFLVHGIGSFCDLKFRGVEEVVDEFRNIALQLTQAHYKSSCEQGIVNRIEVLPISWHGKLHSDETGVDEQLKKITLDSIPRLRAFSNDTILDVLFYTSPVYCQTIISTVGDEMNRVYNLFKERNPTFNGGVSIGGHSLGSLIVFDLLSHQHPDNEDEEDEENEEEDVDNDNNIEKTSNRGGKLCRRISYMMGTMGAGQPKLSYPHLDFQPNTFFAMGSPIGMFVTVRGLDTLGENFSLPTCPAFFNIFHPYDPVAYRIEALVNPELSKLKPVLIPHHKGRKRMHLELKETMARVGADLKQKVFDSMKSTWNTFYQLAMFHKADQPALEEEINQNLQAQLEATPEEEEEENEHLEAEPVLEPTDISLGQLNRSRRIDHVLQEAPFECFNDYLFAITSHVCYWESEDTILMILKEIYTSLNVQTDSKIPQQTMTIERPGPFSSSSSSQNENNESVEIIGMNPTIPINSNTMKLPPPPIKGFVRKS